ncbi:hypothetical protein [Lignipirellula cremea]|uniref:Glutamine amidotransferase domain-containing protein n=1 Tax=Lignipirellula cremea TaxID=2528010 RepID=A0A518E258_9BACT|nr:hypothetical protein [Lignipirellula cremea]QDU98180.1 hypothetical protein Pla8534_60410 [Lignipirellula cremea]
MYQQALGWLLGQDDVARIDQTSVSFGAAWAQQPQGLFWVVLSLVLLFVTAVVFYTVMQHRGPLLGRLALGCGRGLLLGLLVITLADPVLNITYQNDHYPFVYLLFDGTDSMGIEDEYSSEERSALLAAVPAGDQTGPAPASRMEYIQAWLRQKPEDHPLTKLQRDKKARLRAYIFDGNSTSQLRRLDGGDDEDSLDLAGLADQLTTEGQVTALGAAMSDVGRQFGVASLAGVVVVSDFAQNSGQAPLGAGMALDDSPALRLGAPLYTVGVGATDVLDLAVALQTNPQIKQGIETTISVKVRHTGLADKQAIVECWAVRQGEDGQRVEVGRKAVTMHSAVESVEFPFTPETSGDFEFFASVKGVEGEIVKENNQDVRQVRVIDDYFRLLFVAYEPNWEWRFVKEVFHRDPLVGMDGFRTYLASSDPRVRESNVLFEPTLTPKRSDFFANDVVFLGDMPRSILSDRFGDRLKEFVGKFGGGLVVMCGPRFGPAELAGSPVADMLPVIPDPDAPLRDARPFRMQRTPHASAYPFMRLSENPDENAMAWDNMGEIPWYQPVKALHPEQCIVLAEHPSDTCADGVTPQPLIAVRQYGLGEVVYVAYDEMWRLRRRYGDKYYTRFWGQLINRLAISHALGTDKRFELVADRTNYRVDDKAVVLIRAYDENYEPLSEEKLAAGFLTGTLTMAGPAGSAGVSRDVEIPLLRSGEFEIRLPLDLPGEYVLRVKDPFTDEPKELRFEVSNSSAERRSSIRNQRLQNDLAQASNGRAYTLSNVSQLADDLHIEPEVETVSRSRPLWATPLWFIALAMLMLGEWLFRKLMHLR